MKEDFVKKVTAMNPELENEVQWFKKFVSEMDIPFDTNILYLDEDLFVELKKVYTKALGFELVYKKWVWKKNKYKSPISTTI